jgi:hypothetical protein
VNIESALKQVASLECIVGSFHCRCGFGGGFKCIAGFFLVVPELEFGCDDGINKLLRIHSSIDPLLRLARGLLGRRLSKFKLLTNNRMGYAGI